MHLNHHAVMSQKNLINKIMVNAMAYTIELWMHAGGC